MKKLKQKFLNFIEYVSQLKRFLIAVFLFFSFFLRIKIKELFVRIYSLCIQFFYCAKKHIRKIILGSIFLIVALWSYRSVLTFIAKQSPMFYRLTTSNPIHSVGAIKGGLPFINRIVIGNSHCSAVIISETMALTAHHCIPNFQKVKRILFGIPITGKLLSSTEDQEVVVSFTVTAYSARYDIALLEGDFAEFNSAYADFEGRFIPRQSPDPTVFAGCGYAHSAVYRCAYGVFSTYINFFMALYGQIPFPGMSGGGVFRRVSLDLPVIGPIQYDVLVGIISAAIMDGRSNHLLAPTVMGAHHYLYQP